MRMIEIKIGQGTKPGMGGVTFREIGDRRDQQNKEQAHGTGTS